MLLFVIIIFCFIIGGGIAIIYFLTRNSSKTQIKQNSDMKHNRTRNTTNMNKNGINCIRFDADQMGLMTAGRQRSMLQSSEQQALSWINNQKEIEIISISSALGQMNASTTIWFKYKKDKSSDNVKPLSENKFMPHNSANDLNVEN